MSRQSDDDTQPLSEFYERIQERMLRNQKQQRDEMDLRAILESIHRINKRRWSHWGVLDVDAVGQGVIMVWTPVQWPQVQSWFKEAGAEVVSHRWLDGLQTYRIVFRKAKAAEVK